MLFKIEHRTHYRYTRPVFIEPMMVRLTPVSNLRQRLAEFSIDFAAQPMGVSPCSDLEGNAAHQLWFTGLHTSFSIRTHSVVETLCPNPFDFLLMDQGTKMLPAAYSPELTAALSPHRANLPQGQALDTLVAETRQRAENRTLDFLYLLAQAICAAVRHEERAEGDAWTPAQTLSNGHGACRDTAMVFVSACRSVGLAARFVSGYQFMPGSVANLHAWAEVYLPGAGWRGYDPSAGLAVADHHVIVAAAADPALTAPTVGRFRGNGAHSELSFKVTVEEILEPGMSMMQSA